MKRPRASYVQKAERLNRARILLRQGVSRSDAVQQLARGCSLKPRHAYRYLEQAQRLKEPVSRGEEKLAFTVMLPPNVIQRLRAYATRKKESVSEMVSRALRAQLPRSGTGRGYGSVPGPEKTPISLDLVETLASFGCTLEEIGEVVGLSKRTLQRRAQEATFRDALRRGHSWATARVLGLLQKSAAANRVRAQIFLGKLILGQRNFEGPGQNNPE